MPKRTTAREASAVQASALVALLALLGCDAGVSRAETTSAASGGGEGGSGTPGTGSDAGGANGEGGGDGGAKPGSSSNSSTSITVTSASASTSSVSTGAGGAEPVAEVFAHSADTLYRLDLETNTIAVVGAFSGCGGSIIDIALDKDSNMFGTSFGGLWRIDRTNAACTKVAEGSFPNSLSFVPEGTLDPNVEALVGYIDADYVRIDTVTGQVTTIQQDALDGDLVSSGDVVSVIDGPTLLTAYGNACGFSDCVVELDPATGSMIANYGESSFSSVFGVAYWDGKLYGFSDFGDVFQFSTNGGSVMSTSIPIPSTPEFYGAGSTTAAPPGIFN